MKSPQNRRGQQVIAALAVAAVLAGCGSGAQSPISPSGPAASNASHRASPLQTVSTIVGIRNDWTQKIAGSGSAICWSISPPLPSVGPGDLSAPITLSYDIQCPAVSTLPITYGPASATSSCTFNVSYTGTTFKYSVTQGSNTACTAQPSPIGRYDEILTYAQLIPGSKRVSASHGAH